MNIRQEVKYAQGMVERRQEEALTIGNARSLQHAREIHQSMTTCVREVKRHQGNILRAIEDSNAVEAKQVLALLMTAMDWHYRAGQDLVRFGVTQEEVNKTNDDVYGMEGESTWG
jgi:hypothetical protein